MTTYTGLQRKHITISIMTSRSIAYSLRCLPRTATFARPPRLARPNPPLSRPFSFVSRFYSATQSQPSDAAGQPDVAGLAGSSGDPSKRMAELEAFKELAEKTEASLREKLKEQEVSPLTSLIP